MIQYGFLYKEVVSGPWALHAEGQFGRRDRPRGREASFSRIEMQTHAYFNKVLNFMTHLTLRPCGSKS